MESVEDNSILCALPDRVTPDSQISSSPNRSRSGAQSREQEGDVVTLEGFWGLPVEIKVIILQSIQEKWELLTILCRANKSFNELVTPILYANIDLQASRPYRPWRRRGRVLGNDKFQRQEAYLMSVRKHPEYLANARHLGWESIESGWAIFPGMTNIRSIDLSKGGETDPKTIVPVFPNLRSARLSGSFYLGSLECILLTSPYLAELHLNGVGEVQGDIKDRRTQVPTLIPFLDLCSSTPGRMPNLKILTLSRKGKVYKREPLQEPEPALESWARFLRQYMNQLEVLTLELEIPSMFLILNSDAQDAFEKHIVPLLRSGEFNCLKRIKLSGGARLTPEDATQITDTLPSDVDFLYTPSSPISWTSSPLFFPDSPLVTPGLPGPPTLAYLTPGYMTPELSPAYLTPPMADSDDVFNCLSSLPSPTDLYFPLE